MPPACRSLRESFGRNLRQWRGNLDPLRVRRQTKVTACHHHVEQSGDMSAFPPHLNRARASATLFLDPARHLRGPPSGGNDYIRPGVSQGRRASRVEPPARCGERTEEAFERARERGELKFLDLIRPAECACESDGLGGISRSIVSQHPDDRSSGLLDSGLRGRSVFSPSFQDAPQVKFAACAGISRARTSCAVPRSRR